MKKISLFLFTLCVSVASVFAGLNPYAYDLKSEWNPETQILTVHFTLNDHPNTDQKIVNGKPTNETGIQIFALDRNNKSKLYCIYMVPAADIIAHINANNFQYDLDIPINGRDLVTGEALPTGKELTFAVRVQGLNKTNKSTPTAPVYANDSNRPFSCHGVAVNNYQDSPDFGAVYVTEAAKDSELPVTWNWLKGKGKALLRYSPRMGYEASYKKTSAFSDRTNTTLEPHRVCVSDDGRIFVTSYNQYSSGNKPIVWEYKNGEFVEVIRHNNNGGSRGAYGHRVCGMAVKGSGSSLRILLCFLEESDGQTPTVAANWTNSFRVYEYNLNDLGANKNEGVQKFRYKPTGNTYAVTSTNTGYIANAPQSALNLARYYKWYCYTDGFADVAYAGTNKNDIVLSVDFYNGSVYNTYMVYHKNGTDLETYVGPQVKNVKDHYYGGGGLCVYNDGTTEYAVSGRAQFGEYGGDGTNSESSGRIHFYSLGGQSVSSAATYSVSNLKTLKIINDMAVDCANNIYAVSFTDGTAGAGTGRLLAFAMPYSGETTTIAPNISTSQTFNLPPVPNILATDLCCTPHETKPKYIFSFNVNTKPEGAEIRFYTTEETMLADTAASGYDKYDNHNNCAYYYRFAEGELKQGRMSVELDILGHKEGKELSDKKLPAGKLYWNVYLKTRESLAFAPIYVQPLTDASGNRTHYRLHATIDNNPDNDGFGHIYAIDYKREFTTNDDMKNMCDNPCKLMIYSIGEAGIAEEAMDNISSSTRYTLIQSTKTDRMVQPRRPAVAPDGMLYLPDYGDYEAETADLKANPNNEKDHKKITGPHSFEHGGIWLFDPVLNKGKTEVTDMPRFYNYDETTSGLCFYGEGADLKLYKTNTYEEITFHPNDYRTNESYQNNGYRIYNIGNGNGTITHHIGDSPNPTGTITHAIKPLGDSNGSMSIAVTKLGVWLCQHRSGTYSNNYKPDGEDAVALMFYDNNGTRRFESYTASVDGQKLSTSSTAIMQSTPGGGMTVSKDEKRLYVVNHEGNILEFEIGSNSNAMTLSLINKFVNTTTYKTISTMNFDYAGNLVVTTDESYPANASEKTQIVVFTMPYNRDNARTIPASKSERLVPERLSQDFDNDETIKNVNLIGKSFALDLYRPLQGATYNTICLPYDLDLSKLTTPHKLYGAKAMEFTGVSNPTVGGEEVLCLNFTPVTQLQAGKPYIIYVENHVRGLIEFDQITMSNTDPQYIKDRSSSVTYTGVYNPTPIGEGNTILVDQNRLANVTNEGTLSGFRGYFTIPESLRSLKAMISTRHDTPTGLEDMNITERTYQKFLREGRVYIRVGETLYTITGEKVE